MYIRPINISQIYKPNFKQLTIPVFQNRLNCDTVSFTGAPLKAYASNYDAYCAVKSRFKHDFSSAKDFNTKAQAKYDLLVKEIFPSEDELGEKYVCKLEWPIAIQRPEHMPITDSRKQILKEWINFLENPKFENRQGNYSGENESEISGALQDIKNYPSLKLIILESVVNNIKNDNKHISPPLNPYAIAKTVKDLGTIQRNDVGGYSFPNKYRSELVNLIIKRANDSANYPAEQRKGMLEAFPYSDNNLCGMWIKIPSKSHNKQNLKNNVRAVEIISHENWCTKNATYKASACLEDGDFYVFLEKQKDGEYKPTVGMALSERTVMQIQNPSNNDRFGAKYLPVIDFIVNQQKLDFDYYKRDDGIPAGRQYEITKRLKEVFNGKTLEEAIKENDAETIFKYAGIEYTKDENGLLILSKYRPKVIIKKGQVPPILFCELGIDEYALLSKVSKIVGPAEFENSEINSLPDSIKTLSGRVTIRPNQFSSDCKARFNIRWIETHKTRIRN